uniref:Uncharacterized protein n=1 Tax=Junco hyemalis TaxID=40217 RepID=A0A8C5IFP5_JUNHY
ISEVPHPKNWVPLSPQELRSGRFWRGVLAELLATLIFVGVVLGASASPEELAPALAGGLVAGGLLCTLGGPQANPALTLALLCTRKLSALRGALGVLAQCTGATYPISVPVPWHWTGWTGVPPSCR